MGYDRTKQISKKSAKIKDISFTEGGILSSLIISLSLGDERDVVLFPKDEKRTLRKDSPFYFRKGPAPSYKIKDNSLIIDYPAKAPSDNLIFFNLKGHGVGDIEDHNLVIRSDSFLWRRTEGVEEQAVLKGSFGAVDSSSGESNVDAPPGKADFCWVSVEGTPLDFRKETSIAERIRMGYPPLVEKKGYDHIYKIESLPGAAPCAILTDHARTLAMEVYTTFAALYLYTANRFSGKDVGKGGCLYPVRAGVALAPARDPFLKGSSLKARDNAKSLDTPGHQVLPEGRMEYRFFALPQDFLRGVRGR